MDQYVKIGQLARKLSVKTSTIRSWIQDGTIPRPTQITPKTLVWPEEQINDWMETRPLMEVNDESDASQTDNGLEDESPKRRPGDIADGIPETPFIGETTYKPPAGLEGGQR